jgi:hypothetical protein
VVSGNMSVTSWDSDMSIKAVTISKAKALSSVDPRFEGIELTERQLRTRDEFRTEITNAWEGIEKRFVLIGQYLIQAKGKLPHGEYLEMVDKDLPFTRTAAYRMKMVAEAISNGRLIESELPSNYTILYEFASLTDAELQAARDRHLVRPDVRRQEVAEFKREFRTRKNNISQTDKALLLKRRQQLLAQQAVLAHQLAEIESQLGPIDDDDINDRVIEGNAVEVAENAEE